MKRFLPLPLFLLFSLSTCFAQADKSILIAYDSRTGHTQAFAEMVREGCYKVPAVQVALLDISAVSPEQLLAADAIILGSPVYNANPSAAMLDFIQHWPFEGQPLKDKIGAAFVTSGGISAGEELAQFDMLSAMMIFGMVIVGGDGWSSAFGATAVVGEGPFDIDRAGIDPIFRTKAERLGQRVAEAVLRWNR